MKTPTWSVTPHTVAQLVRAGSGRPAPDGPDFDPRGPIGPIAYELYRHMANRWDAVALRPLPIPPPEEAGRLVAQNLVAELVWRANLAAGDGKAPSGASTGAVADRISDFVDWCGTGRLAQKVADLLRKLGPKGGGEPPPRPQEDARMLVVMGAELFAARDLVEGLGAAGEKLMEQGLQQLS